MRKPTTWEILLGRTLPTTFEAAIERKRQQVCKPVNRSIESLEAYREKIEMDAKEIGLELE